MGIHPEAPARALQRRAGRRARPRVPHIRSFFLARGGIIAALAAVAILLTGGTSRAAEPFSSGFPHLFYDDTGWLDGNLSVIRRFHVLSTAFWNAEGTTAGRLDSLAVMNPDLVRLAYVNAAGLSLPHVADPNHIVNRFAAGIQNQWLVRNELGQIVYWDPGIPNMPLLNLSTRCPRVGGRTYGEYLADFAAQQILANGRFDGIMFDNIWNSAQWVNSAIPGSLDLDNNAVADHPDSVDTWWLQGLTAMGTRFRAQTGPDVIAIGNGNGRQFSTLNGRYFESFPYREGFAGSMTQVEDWQAYGRPPILLAGVTRSNEQDFRLMRFGLTTALIGGFFSFHYAEEHSWPNPVFYDEYGVSLGQPVGEPIELGIDVIGSAEFETGLPPSFPGSCGTGVAQWTTAPNLVIDGVGSLHGLPGSGTNWWIYLCSNPSAVPLTGGQTYTLTFRYRIVAEPPGTGIFFVGARSDQNQSASDRAMIHFDPPVGTVGEARADVTLGPYSNYYFYFGMYQGGQIVIDSIKVLRGRGGAFRRNYEHGLALVNPTNAPITVDVEPGFRRIAGQLNPLYNNGQPATRITLAAEDGIVLLREPAGVPPEEPPSSPPPAPGVVIAYPNPVPLTQGDPAVVNGVPAGGSVTIVSAAGRHIRRIEGDQGRCAWDLRSERGTRAAPGVYLVIVRDAAEQQVGSTRLTLAR